MTIEVFDETGRRLALRDTGKAGGEGAIYSVEGNPLWVAKIYHARRADTEQHDKVKAMAAGPPIDPAWEARRHRSIAWAQHLLYRDQARTVFAGFTMPAIDVGTFRESHAYFDPADRLARFGGGYTWRHLLTAACNLASSVAAIHAEGHRVGDLRETNVLVAPSALICLIDCDSFQIRDPKTGRVFPTRVGTAEYLPPELHGVAQLGDHDRTESDRFALAVLLFKFLMLGVHPYQARGRLVEDAPSTEAKIAKGIFPYERRGAVEPPPFAPSYALMPPALRALFKRCFVDGHRRPKRRPTPDEWFGALRSEAKRLKGCHTNPHHWYGHHLRACPWCKMAEDPFPAPGTAVGTQRPVRAAVPRPAPPSAPQPPRERVARLRPALRMLGRVRLSKRRVLIALGAAAVLVAAVSPLGHAESPPNVRRIPTRERRIGPCPYDGSASSRPPAWCKATWSIGGARHVEKRSRKLFVWFTAERSLVIDYEVTFKATRARACSLPWVDNATYERERPSVCLSVCPERIELRQRAAARPLLSVGGLGARDGPIRCGVTYAGSWTFDVGGAQGPMSLHHPGLEPVTLEV